MLSIGQFLKRIQNKRGKEVFVRSVISDAVMKYTGVDIKPEEISFSSNTIYTKNAPPTARSQIFIKKQNILEEISKNQEFYTLTDIK